MKAILNLKILTILLHTSTTQFVNYPPQGVQNYVPYQQNYYGMSNNNFRRRSYHLKPARIGRTVPLWSESEYTDSSEKCTCSYRSCNECYKAKPCCKSMCQRCNTGMVVIPYPVPFLIVTTQSTTQAVNTIVTKTTTPKLTTMTPKLTTTTPIITTTTTPKITTTTPELTTTTPELTTTTPDITTTVQATTEVTESTEIEEITKSTKLYIFKKIDKPIDDINDYESRISIVSQSTIAPISSDTSSEKKKKLRCPLIPNGVCVPKKHKKIQIAKVKPKVKKMRKTGVILPSDHILMRRTLNSLKNTVPPSFRKKVPKLQILPIPDSIAVKLLSQIRDIERYV